MANFGVFLTVDEVAEKIGVSHVSIRNWLREGKLKGSRAGKKWLISEEDLAEFIGTEPKQESKEDVIQRPKIEELEQADHPDYLQEAIDEIKEEWIEQLERRFPYPFTRDEISYQSDDGGSYLVGGEPESYHIYYAKKLEEEVFKFNRLMTKLKQKYDVKDEDIDEIKRTADNLKILKCSSILYPSF